MSVPAYHIAGGAGALSALYSGRRILYLSVFDEHRWIDLVRSEMVTQARVVPTMLERIVELVEADRQGLPSLRHLCYGGARAPVALVERAMRLLPGVSFVNAYGLTETSSTTAVLTPDDHRECLASDAQDVRRRLGSVGKPLSTVEVEIRDAEGKTLPAGDRGEIYVRGEQVFHPGRSAGVEDLQNFVRARLRSSKTPQLIEIRDEMPYNETGKLLRRAVKESLVPLPAAEEAWPNPHTLASRCTSTRLMVGDPGEIQKSHITQVIQRVIDAIIGPLGDGGSFHVQSMTET